MWALNGTVDVPEQVSSHPEGHDAATQVKVAISWLERTRFVFRDENRTRLFQGVPATRDDAALNMGALDLSPAVDGDGGKPGWMYSGAGCVTAGQGGRRRKGPM